MSPDLAAAIRAGRDDLIAILLEEEGQASGQPAPPAAAPRAQPAREQPVEPEEAVHVVEPPAEPESEQQAPAVVLVVVGAGSWPASRAAVIRDRLARLPIETKVLILGDIESRRKKDGAPKGVAAIAWAAATALGLEIEPVADVEAALRRAGRALAFHQALDRSTSTAAVVDRAKAAGVACEVVTGRVPRPPWKS